MNSGDKDAIEAIISHNGAKIHTNLSSPWRENPNRRKSVGDESPNGPVSGSFSYIFALVIVFSLAALVEESAEDPPCCFQLSDESEMETQSEHRTPERGCTLYRGSCGSE